MPTFFFGILFSGHLVLVLLSTQFHQASHAFLTSFAKARSRVGMRVCAHVHTRIEVCVCVRTHSYCGEVRLKVLIQYGGNEAGSHSGFRKHIMCFHFSYYNRKIQKPQLLYLNLLTILAHYICIKFLFLVSV